LFDRKDHEDVEQAKSDGWFETLEEAAGLVPNPDAEPDVTRDEMLQKAEQIGLKVDKRWSDSRLLAEIEKASE
jgi:hypothetical protein